MNIALAMEEINAKKGELSTLQEKQAVIVQELNELQEKHFGIKEGQRLDVLGIIDLIERVTNPDKAVEA